MTNLPIPIDDGFDETEAGDRVIQGTLLRCVDGKWSTKDGRPLPTAPLLAVSTATVLQHWQNNRPVETIWKRPGEPFADADDLNAAIPVEQWEKSSIDGAVKPPWQRCHVVYLLLEATAARFTYVNSTYGAIRAVNDLRQRTRDMRGMRGENVYPLVTLDTAPMKTKFGQKLRPEFTIVGWRGRTPAGLKEITPPTPQEAMQDQVLF